MKSEEIAECNIMDRIPVLYPPRSEGRLRTRSMLLLIPLSPEVLLAAVFSTESASTKTLEYESR